MAERNLGSSGPGIEYDNAYHVIAVGTGGQALPAARIDSVGRGHSDLLRQWKPVRSIRSVLGLSITFTYHVEGALVRTLIGKDLTRVYNFSDKQLIVKSSNQGEHWSVVWEHY